MSIGAPSSLGTLLVQRLDAVLGTTLSQQANLVSGARPDAVSQPTNAESVEAAKNELVRHPRETVDRSTAQVEQGARQTIDKPDVGARLRAGNDAANAPNTSSTPSAPTRLGFTARTILALLAEFPEQAPPVTGKALLNTPAVVLPGGATAAAANTAADTATTLPNNTLSQNGSKSGSIATQPVAVGEAVTGQVVPTASALAKALANALQTSGLFYEAHLADLAFGKRLATTLATEPQAQLGKPTPPNNQAAQGQQSPNAASTAHTTQPNTAQPGTTQSGAATTQQTTPVAPQHTATHSGDNQSNNLQQQGPGTSGQASATHAAQANANQLPAATHLLVRQQLEVLANQTFAWQGEAWPNTPLQWEVRRHEGPWPGDANNAQQHWATRIRIHLPRMGTVDARINLVNAQLLLQLSAPDCAATLESGSQTLRQRLGAAGLFVEQLAIDASLPESGAPYHGPDDE